VDISAPGENVYVARRTAPEDQDHALVQPGEGTSFAVANVAGCAALWLERHGVGAVRAAARTRGATVQTLFRAALHQTAHRPPGWDASDMGAGVIDAAALLGLPLEGIVLPGAPLDGHPLANELGAAFNWKRHGLEGGFLAFDAAQRSDARRSAALESPVAARPSRAFLNAAARAGVSAERFQPAGALLPPVTPPLPEDRPLKRLAKLPSGGAEAAGVITESSARDFLKGDGGREIVELLEAALAEASSRSEADPSLKMLRQQVLDAAPGVVKDLAEGTARSSADFKGVRYVSAEALIRLTGRPALRVVDGVVDGTDPRLGAWAADLYMPRNQIRPLMQAVGRIEIMDGGKPLHIGTGTHIAPGVVMTNRHVMEAFADVLPGAGAPRRFAMTADAAINFDDAAVDEGKRFKIKGVLTAGPQPIGRRADPSKLDVALLEIETGPGTPAHVKVSKTANFGAGSKQTLAVVGYPVKPSAEQLVDPESHSISDKISDVLWSLYGRDYGVKYVSPGEVMAIAGGLSGDARGWAFAHDATTLPGNSGSAIFALGPAIEISGLHFGGAPMRINMAHDLGVVRKALDADHAIIGVDWPV
jgi:serine protease